MSWKKQRRLQGRNKYYSLSKKLRREKKSNDQFEVMLSQLTLEEVIGLKLELASKEIGINISIANNYDDSEFIVTTKNFYKKRTKFLIDAHKTNIPVYVIRKNTLNQIVSLLGTIKKQQQQSIRKSDPAIIEAENMAK